MNTMKGVLLILTLGAAVVIAASRDASTTANKKKVDVIMEAVDNHCEAKRKKREIGEAGPSDPVDTNVPSGTHGSSGPSGPWGPTGPSGSTTGPTSTLGTNHPSSEDKVRRLVLNVIEDCLESDN
ncbi:uncharacterized protein [Watersipora subatra]|uniref:uncharacterized protein n=1 Tax=Watersipora subatra TaxID=2589382 RepID=UPI00355B82CE